MADAKGAVPVDRVQQALDVPLQRALGVRPHDPDDPARGVWFVAEELADNGNGGLHAAALGVAFEVAGYLAVVPTLSGAEHAVTHSISTQLVAGAGVGERVDVTARLDRRTRNLAFVSATATVDDRLIARSQLTKSIIARR